MKRWLPALFILIFLTAAHSVDADYSCRDSILDSIAGSAAGGWGDREFKSFIGSASIDEDVKSFRKGLQLMKENNFKAALECFTKALKITKGWKIALYNRALCYEKLGKTALARRDYLDSMGFDPLDGKSLKIIDAQPAHLSMIVTFFEIHVNYCSITQFGRTTGKNRSFKYFYDTSPNLNSADQTYDFISGDCIERMDKKYSSTSDQAGFGMWLFWFYPAKIPGPCQDSEYSVTYKVRDLPHLHGNSVVSIGSDPIPNLTDRWILAFAFPEGTRITSMFDLHPYKYERREGWLIFYYDYIGVRKPMALHIQYTLTGDRKKGLDARSLSY